MAKILEFAKSDLDHSQTTHKMALDALRDVAANLTREDRKKSGDRINCLALVVITRDGVHLSMRPCCAQHAAQLVGYSRMLETRVVKFIWDEWNCGAEEEDTNGRKD